MPPRAARAPRLHAWLLGVLLACAGPALASTPPTEATLKAQRQAFLDAEAALKAGDAARLQALKARLRDYPLLPYLRLREFTDKLATASADDVRQFLASYPDTPFAARLRTRWVTELAAQGRWDDIIQDYAPGPEAEPECAYRAALLQRDRLAAALQGFDVLWVRGQPLPELCLGVAQSWAARGLPAGIAWQRFSAAMQARQAAAARQTLPFLDAADQDWARIWLAVDQAPAMILREPALQVVGSERIAEIVAATLDRWIDRDSVEALPALDAIAQRRTVPADRLAPLRRKLAIHIAARDHPAALARLDALDPALEDDSVREWRVRVLLRRGDWLGTLRALDRQPSEQRAQPVWRYWRARALEGIGRRDDANSIYRDLSTLRDYHGFLASLRLGAAFRIVNRPLAPAEEEMRALAAQPPILRARELLLLGRLPEARSEWDWALRGSDAKRQVAAAQLAAEWSWYGQTIIYLARAGEWDDLTLRFPTPYLPAVDEAARTANIAPAWVFAVARQESVFQPDVRSGAGALGLLQLLPDTAKQLAGRAGLSYRGPGTLLDPRSNLLLGAIYLRQLQDRYGGNPVLATAAYNAGPRRVDGWLPVNGEQDADVWVETLPFGETRQYVKRVWEYMGIYEARLGLQPRSMAAFTRVAPAPAPPPPAATTPDEPL